MTSSNMNYTGPSMNPTLKAGDGLGVIPYRGKEIRIGDVVVFRHPEAQHNVVHRVVSVNSHGVRTRGDNSITIDPWVLRPGDIIGRVISAQRNHKNVSIHGGAWGRALAPVLWTRKRANSTVSRILHPAYHLLARSGLFRKCLPLHRKTRILSFNRPQGTELHLLLGTRVIGRRPPGGDQWQIARPFRLFLDETSLPS
jgi:signal peptidase